MKQTDIKDIKVFKISFKIISISDVKLYQYPFIYHTLAGQQPYMFQQGADGKPITQPLNSIYSVNGCQWPEETC